MDRPELPRLRIASGDASTAARKREPGLAPERAAGAVPADLRVAGFPADEPEIDRPAHCRGAADLGLDLRGGLGCIWDREGFAAADLCGLVALNRNLRSETLK